MSEYKHGSFAEELATTIQGVVSTKANITFIVGTAPINLVDENNVNKLVRLTNLNEAVRLFGYDDNFKQYTLSEAIFVFFALFRVAPVYFVNVLDPAKHKKAAEQETQTQVNSQVILSQLGAIKSSVVVKVGSVDKVLDSDYSLDFNKSNQLVVKVLSEGSIKPADKLVIDYEVLDSSKVMAQDIIGGIDNKGNYSGIELVQKCRPQYRELPGSLIAPAWSKNISVSQALLSNAKALNTKFIANALVDLDTSKIVTYADAVDVKAKAGLNDPHYNVCIGDLLAAGVVYNQSTFLAAVKQRITAKNNGFPNQNPSNKSYEINGYQINGQDVFLDEAQAQYLNGNGLILAINSDNGWVCWGNRTACYPGNNDVKDFDIAVRDCGNYLINSCIIACSPNVDEIIDRAFILRVESKLQAWLDGLVGSRKLISGSISFPQDENQLDALLAGNVVFLLDYCTSTTASSITTKVAFNANDLTRIFGE